MQDIKDYHGKGGMQPVGFTDRLTAIACGSLGETETKYDSGNHRYLIRNPAIYIPSWVFHLLHILEDKPAKAFLLKLVVLEHMFELIGTFRQCLCLLEDPFRSPSPMYRLCLCSKTFSELLTSIANRTESLYCEA